MSSQGLPKMNPAKPFANSRRVHGAFTASVEKRVLVWLAERTPRWVTSDQLTLLGLFGQVGAGVSYALARHGMAALPIAVLCIVLNWFGDSLDGTLARVRGLERPRLGFYVDHVIDIVGSVALMGGLASSGLLHPLVAAAMLISFLALSAESYLATHVLGQFQLSQSHFGPTEIRLLLITGTFALLRSPYATVFGRRWLLFDLGGTIAAACMAAIALLVMARHTAQLYREEPVP